MFTRSKQETVEREGRDDGAGPARPIWIGYGLTGGRISLSHAELRKRLIISGRRADEMAALLAFACREAGLRTLVLDLDGSIAERVSGYFEAYDFNCFLYDAFEIEEEDAVRHSQLLAAAYTSALGLDAEEEAILIAAMHKQAVEDTRASPAPLFAPIGAVEGFRGFYVEKLQGRIGGLRYLEVAEGGSLRSLLSLPGSLVSFRSARYAQAMELAAAAFIAKLLDMWPAAKTTPDVLIVNGAHRLFKATARPAHTNRLLTEWLDSQMTVILACDETQFLDEAVPQAFPLKIMSSDAWNEGVEDRWKANTREPLLPNAFVLADGHYGHQRAFIARNYEQRASPLRSGPAAVEPLNREQADTLTTLILQDIKSYEAPTRNSID